MKKRLAVRRHDGLALGLRLRHERILPARAPLGRLPRIHDDDGAYPRGRRAALAAALAGALLAAIVDRLGARSDRGRSRAAARRRSRAGCTAREIPPRGRPQRWTTASARWSRFRDLPAGPRHASRSRVRGQRAPVVVAVDGVVAGLLAPGTASATFERRPPGAGAARGRAAHRRRSSRPATAARWARCLSASSLHHDAARAAAARPRAGRWPCPRRSRRPPRRRAGGGTLAASLAVRGHGRARGRAALAVRCRALAVRGRRCRGCSRPSRSRPGSSALSGSARGRARAAGRSSRCWPRCSCRSWLGTSPLMVVSDAVFHANNLARVAAGDLFLDERDPARAAVPLPVRRLVLRAARPALRARASTASRWCAGARRSPGVAAAAGLFVLLVRARARRGGARRRAAAAPARARSTCYSYGNLSNVFAQSMTVLFFAWWAGRAPGGRGARVRSSSPWPRSAHLSGLRRARRAGRGARLGPPPRARGDRTRLVGAGRGPAGVGRLLRVVRRRSSSGSCRRLGEGGGPRGEGPGARPCCVQLLGGARAVGRARDRCWRPSDGPPLAQSRPRPAGAYWIAGGAALPRRARCPRWRCATSTR